MRGCTPRLPSVAWLHSQEPLTGNGATLVATAGNGATLAATKSGGDWTCGSKLAGPDRDGFYYIVGRVKAKLDAAERNRLILQTARVLDGPSCPITIPQDPGAAGKEVAQALVKMLAGFPVEAVPTSGSKAQRADPFAAQVNAGNVRMLKGAWNAETLEVMRRFTGEGDAEDDEIDAMGDAFKKLALRTTTSQSTVGKAKPGNQLRT